MERTTTPTPRQQRLAILEAQFARLCSAVVNARTDFGTEVAVLAAEDVAEALADVVWPRPIEREAKQIAGFPSAQD